MLVKSALQNLMCSTSLLLAFFLSSFLSASVIRSFLHSLTLWYTPLVFFPLSAHVCWLQCFPTARHDFLGAFSWAIFWTWSMKICIAPLSFFYPHILFVFYQFYKHSIFPRSWPFFFFWVSSLSTPPMFWFPDFTHRSCCQSSKLSRLPCDIWETVSSPQMKIIWWYDAEVMSPMYCQLFCLCSILMSPLTFYFSFMFMLPFNKAPHYF